MPINNNCNNHNSKSKQSQIQTISSHNKISSSRAKHLQELVATNNSSTVVQVEGYVTAKRRLGHSFCLLDNTEKTHQLTQAVLLQAMLK
jgi:hypothetical protein